MAELKVLFFDDQEELYHSVWKDLTYSWDEIYPQIALDHVYYQDFRKARDVIKANAAGFNVFIFDLLVSSSDEGEHKKTTDGLELIKLARSHLNCVVIALSATSPNFHPNLQSDAMIAGADIFVIRGQLKQPANKGYLDLCHKLFEKCVENDLISDPVSLVCSANPKLDYIIAQIGKPNVNSLYQQVLREPKLQKIEVYYLSPGVSGAFVLQVNAHVEGRPVAAHLLKINWDRELLRKEIANLPLVGGYNTKLFAQYLPLRNPSGDLPESNGWYAIGAAFERDTTTLRDWLNTNPEESRIPEILSALFSAAKGGLGKGYNEMQPRTAPVLTSMNLTPSRKARIIMALEELKEVGAHADLGNDPRWAEKSDELENFLLLDGVFSHERILNYCPCHGDFHSRNILIGNTAAYHPTIIDTAEFGEYHWSTDFVRLIVDFVLSSYHFGVDSYLWGNLEHSLNISKAIVELTGFPDESIPNNAVISAINWMLQNIKEIFDFIESDAVLQRNIWELQLSLAIEFLRGAYRTDIPTPKRLLALQSAYVALQAAERSFAKM